MKFIKFSLSIVALLIVSNAYSEPYTQATFDNLIKEGRPMLVEVQADWCSTCQKQGPITSALLKQSPYKRITSLKVDFDKQKDVLRTLHVPMQSTLIVFKNGKEVGRSLGDTSSDSIENLLKKAI